MRRLREHDVSIKPRNADGYSRNVVSCAPSSATNTAISSAGSVLLALAETRWVEPGGSKNDWPTLKVSPDPPPGCEGISPLVVEAVAVAARRCGGVNHPGA